MGEWQDISTAPKDGSPFLALNHDQEVWVAKWLDRGGFAFRTNGRHEPQRFEHVFVDGETLLREDKEYAAKHACWRNDWCLWTRMYEFAPSHWLKLPPPPESKD